MLGFSFFGIEIAIGIGIDAAGRLILSNLVASSAETVEHRGHPVEFILQFLVSRRNISSIPIAIPISIWIIPKIDIPEHFLEGVDRGAARQPEAVVKWLLVAKLVAVGRVSAGRAAEWLGVTKPEFLQEMQNIYTVPEFAMFVNSDFSEFKKISGFGSVLH
ncbi:MAG: hypothetical protein SWH68_02475 [Thermodesulfobacteriota bacterium]|nr:hypothetical protein [Thermodesulfobacteriota bacterium]